MLGVLAMRGPLLKQDERIYGATLLDIAPTILSLFGLPVGKDMPGRVLGDAFVDAPEVEWVDSWEGGAARDVDSKAASAADPASLRQLAALGYIGQDAVEGARAALLAEWEASFNLATVHLNHGRPAAAFPLLDRLCGDVPKEIRYQHSRLLALSHSQRHEEVLAGVQELEKAGVVSAQFDLLAASALNGLGRGSEVMGRLRSAAAREPLNAVVAQVSGDYLLAQGRLREAAESYAKAIALDPESAQALCGMAQVQLAGGDFVRAAEFARSSLQQVFWNPVAHFRLGQALAGAGDRVAARCAYERALEQAPSYGEALYRLAAMLEEDGDFLGAAECRRRLAEGT
jgi:tetratricopeptide (TPR) repeat protein